MSELFMPHGMCFLWQEDVLFLHVVSDAAIAAAYFSIPLALLYFVKRRKDLEFKWLLPLFAAFIVACGITHLFAIWVIWNPNYWAEGFAKAATGAVSVATAIVLWPLLPKLIGLPSPAQLRAANRNLESQMASRMTAQEALERLNAELEKRVEVRTRDLARSNEELEKFAYHASHDLKAPLRAVNQISQWIASELPAPLSPTLEESLSLMQARIKRMEKMLDDLLEYSRAGRRRTPEDEESVAGDQLVADVVLLASAPEHVQVVASPKLAEARVARMPLQQILLNLVVNAIKHNTGEHPRVSIGFEDNGSEYVFSVADNGPGIDPRFHEAIFETFRTLRPKDQIDSTGIGLAIVRKAVEIGGGRIELESSPGRGSTFTVFWPRPDET